MDDAISEAGNRILDNSSDSTYSPGATTRGLTVGEFRFKDELLRRSFLYFKLTLSYPDGRGIDTGVWLIVQTEKCLCEQPVPLY